MANENQFTGLTPFDIFQQGAGDADPFVDAFIRNQAGSAQRIREGLAESQRVPGRNIVDKLTPILEGVAFLADVTSGNRKKRAEALGKLRNIQGVRRGRETAATQQRRQKFLDQLSIEEITGRLKGQALQTKISQAERKTRKAATAATLARRPEKTAKEKQAEAAATLNQDIIEGKTLREDLTYGQIALLRSQGFDYEFPLSTRETTALLEKNIKEIIDAELPDSYRKQLMTEMGAVEGNAEYRRQRSLREDEVREALADQVDPPPLGDLGLGDDVDPSDFLPAVDLSQELISSRGRRLGERGPQPRFGLTRKGEQDLGPILDFIKEAGSFNIVDLINLFEGGGERKPSTTTRPTTEQ